MKPIKAYLLKKKFKDMKWHEKKMIIKWRIGQVIIGLLIGYVLIEMM